MNFRLQVPSSLSRFLDCVKPAGRANIFSAASAALHNLVQRHLLAIKPKHHKTAQSLGAVPTDHIGKGIGGMSHTFDDHSATVIIPIAGLNRAFNPLHIVARHARALTLPVNSISYGKRVRELTAHGWKVFRPRGKDILFGSINNDDPRPLYLLRRAVIIPQDRSLLPTDNEINATVARAMMAEINRASAA